MILNIKIFLSSGEKENALEQNADGKYNVEVLFKSQRTLELLCSRSVMHNTLMTV